jgi:hypothetical protein
MNEIRKIIREVLEERKVPKGGFFSHFEHLKNNKNKYDIPKKSWENHIFLKDNFIYNLDENVNDLIDLFKSHSSITDESSIKKLEDKFKSFVYHLKNVKDNLKYSEIISKNTKDKLDAISNDIYKLYKENAYFLLKNRKLKEVLNF